MVAKLVTNFILELSDAEDLLDLIVHAEAVLWQGFRRHEVLRLWDESSRKFSRFLNRYGQQDDLVMQLMTLDPFSNSSLGWLTPDFILTKVLPVLPVLPLAAKASLCTRRQVPEALLKLLFQPASNGFSLAGLVGASWQDETAEVSMVESDETPAESRLTLERWSDLLEETLPGWYGKAEEIFRAFRWEAPVDEEIQQMSMNEFLAVLICCSLGTAAEKASALFELCAEDRVVEPEFPHRIPLSRVVIQRRGEADSAPAMVPGTPPSTYVLEIEVWANEYRQRAGSVFVESLWPWTKGEEELRRQVLPFVVWSDCSPAARRVGELRLGISWTPKNPQTPEVGLLSLCVSRLRLYDFQAPEVTDTSTLPRPWLQARTLDKDGISRPILLRGRSGFAQKDGLLRSWAAEAWQTMTWSSKDATLNEDGQSWSWATDVLQSSPKLRFTAGAGRPAGHGTSISLQRCRQVAECLLRRSGLYLTARQVSQLADRCFHRSGRSNAMVDALVLVGSEPPPFLPPSGIRRVCQESGREFVDVTSQLVHHMEKSFSSNSIPLENLPLKDPFPGLPKILWIRRPDAKDVIFHWNAGNAMELTMDSDLNNELLTKEEFVSCVLAHPALSEPLKRRQPHLLTMDAMRTLTLDVILELSPKPEAVPQYLPVLFGELAGRSGAQDGAGHGIKVFLTDTMWDFLEKVQEACLWQAKLPQELSKHYASVTLGLEHEVFAFVPQTLATKPKESLHDLMRAHADAASWLILNKDSTFQSYASILYQQPDMLPCLKVSKR